MKKRKLVSILLVCILFMQISIPVQAAAKEEVVYIVTDAAGDTDGIYVVNIFNGGEIVDYGDYSQVKMLTSNEAIKKDGDRVSFSTKARKVYYEGTLARPESPWSIRLRYFLDGREYRPDEIAGKSGKLEIKFHIDRNQNEKEDFFDNYALQASFTLDTDLCSNIKSEGATIANVGSDKQLTYTILPGKGIDTVITADVIDFEMAAVNINGVKLNLDVDLDDQEMKNRVDELVDGIKKVDDGAITLEEGTLDLKEGGRSLSDGTLNVSSGIAALDNGVQTLQQGITSMQKGIESLNGQSGTIVNGSAEVRNALLSIQSSLSAVSMNTEQLAELTASSEQIKTGIATLSTGADTLLQNLGYTQYKELMRQNGLDIDSLITGNTQGAAEITALADSMQKTLAEIQGLPEYAEQAAQLEGQINQLQNIAALLNGNNAAFSGTESYLTGLAESTGQLSAGAAELNTNYQEFDKAITGLVSTLEGMTGSLADLSKGINTMVTQYTKLDDGINSYTDGVSALAEGYKQIVSGASQLAAGSQELYRGSGALSNGAAALYQGMTEFCEGAGELSEGTAKMREETKDLDTQIENEVDEILQSIKGDDGETTSFVSTKNRQVDSVQFVIRTSAIELPEPKLVTEMEEEATGFGQKLIKLFKR